VYQDEIDRRDRLIVGVNDFQLSNEELEIPVLKIEPRVEREQVTRLRDVKTERDSARVSSALAGLRRAARGTDNTMPHFIECSRAYCTLQEMCDVLREEWGEYVEKPAF